MVESNNNKPGYLNRSIGGYTSSRFGNETEGKEERRRLRNKALDAINKMELSELKQSVTELQRKANIK